jgi:hypothetical protein
MNGKTEFLDHVGDRKVKCALINFHKNWYDEKQLILPRGYTQEEYNNFLNQLDQNYDDGFGSQYIYGTIWYQDRTWSDRREYDGSEWWEHHQVPEVPKECARSLKEILEKKRG